MVATVSPVSWVIVVVISLIQLHFTRSKEVQQ